MLKSLYFYQLVDFSFVFNFYFFFHFSFPCRVWLTRMLTGFLKIKSIHFNFLLFPSIGALKQTIRIQVIGQNWWANERLVSFNHFPLDRRRDRFTKLVFSSFKIFPKSNCLDRQKGITIIKGSNVTLIWLKRNQSTGPTDISIYNKIMKYRNQIGPTIQWMQHNVNQISRSSGEGCGRGRGLKMDESSRRLSRKTIQAFVSRDQSGWMDGFSIFIFFLFWTCFVCF